MKYFESTKLRTFMNQWLVVNRLHLLTFLIDVLGLLKVFQKACQSDTISILDVIQKQQDLFAKLESCIDGEVEGGWEELFLKDLNVTGSKFSLYGIPLKKAPVRWNCSLSSATRQFIIRKLLGQLRIRLGIDESLQQTLRPLVDMKSTVSSQDLQQCYSFLLPDCDENGFYTEYYRAADLLRDCDCTTTLSYLQKLQELCPNDLSIMKCGLARVAAAKPHSADVERLISELKLLDLTKNRF